MTKSEKLSLLNANTMEERLANLEKLIAAETQTPQAKPQFANNHIHTTYSFSPYSPTAAVYFAREAGLQTAGIMDHDSIGGAEEFRRAGEIAGIAVTCGIECRVDMRDTPFAGRRLNHPDQKGVAYMAVHSVMPDQIAYLQETTVEMRKRRNTRNRMMVQRINALMSPIAISLDFDTDVLPTSLYHEGGAVTERHLLWALSGKLLAIKGVSKTIEALEELGIVITETQKAKLFAEDDSVQYDLLGILKAELVEQFYIPATDELFSLSELAHLAEEVGAILCYAYLGDVGESVTGDKRAQAFEDCFLDELFIALKDVGVRGITYMPSRNSDEQIARLQGLCKEYGMLEICGEDVNSPNQSFICDKLVDPRFSHLVEATWNLIEREKKGKIS